MQQSEAAPVIEPIIEPVNELVDAVFVVSVRTFTDRIEHKIGRAHV